MKTSLALVVALLATTAVATGPAFAGLRDTQRGPVLECPSFWGGVKTNVSPYSCLQHPTPSGHVSSPDEPEVPDDDEEDAKLDD